MKFKAAIFDMDETLVEIPPSFEIDWTRKCFQSFSDRAYTESEVKSYLRLPIPEREKFLLNMGFTSTQQYLDMWLTKEALDERFAYLTVYEDTNALLELREDGLRLGLVTAAPENLGETQKKKLEQYLGVTDLFDSSVYIHRTSFPKKPNPAALEYCIAELAEDKENTFYCGNLNKDVQMAKYAGVTPILIDRCNATDYSANPITINSLFDLIRL